MPMKPKRPCRYPGCPNLCEDGEQYCPEHKALMEKHYETFTRGYSTGKRYGRSWQRVRTDMRNPRRKQRNKKRYRENAD